MKKILALLPLLAFASGCGGAPQSQSQTTGAIAGTALPAASTQSIGTNEPGGTAPTNYITFYGQHIPVNGGQIALSTAGPSYGQQIVIGAYTFPSTTNMMSFQGLTVELSNDDSPPSSCISSNENGQAICSDITGKLMLPEGIMSDRVESLTITISPGNNASITVLTESGEINWKVQSQ